MKLAAMILATLAVIIFSAGQIEASNLVEQANIVAPKHRRFVPPINIPRRAQTPRRDYAPRKPSCPTPQYMPSRARPSRDVRGGKQKIFAPPQAPHR